MVKLNKYREVDNVDVLIDNRQDTFKFSRHSQYVNNDFDLHLLAENGVYPYDYMDCWGKFDEAELPPKDALYIELSKSHISDRDYDRAKIVWNILNHDLYVRTYVLLLIDVSETF